MTAPTAYPSLDKILTEVEPVEPVPFDVEAHMRIIYAAPDRYRAKNSREQVARFLNGLRCDIEAARSAAVALESELAEQTDRIAEAKGLLTDALVWLDDRHDNVRDYVLEAISALEVKP